LRCKLDTAGSRHREFDHFCPFGQFDRRGFKPERQRFLGILKGRNASLNRNQGKLDISGNGSIIMA
jgi:hypothetical protein